MVGIPERTYDQVCLAITLTPTSRGIDALACLDKAVAEATRLIDLRV